MASACCGCGPEDRQRRVLMVRRLHPSVTMPALLQAFGTHGSITGCKVFTHKSGRSAGCASVEFSTHAAACAALGSLNNTMLHGKAVQLAWYNPAHTSALQAVAMGGDAAGAVAAAGAGQLQIGLAALVGDQQAAAGLPLELQIQLLQLQQQQQHPQQQAVGDVYAAAMAAAAVQQATAAALALPRAPSTGPQLLGAALDAQQQQLVAAAAALGLGAPALLAASAQQQQAVPPPAPQQQGPALLAAGLTNDELMALQLAQQQRRSHSQVPLLDRPPSGFTATSPILAQQPSMARSDPGGMSASAAQQPGGRLPSPSLPPAVPRTSSTASLQAAVHGGAAAGMQQRISTDGIAPGNSGLGVAVKAPSGRSSVTGGWPNEWGSSPLHAERAASLPLPMPRGSQPGYGSGSSGGGSSAAAPIAGSAPGSGGGWLPPGLPAPPTPTSQPQSASQQPDADALGALPHTPDAYQPAAAVSAAAAAAAQYLALLQQQQQLQGQQDLVLAAATAEAAAAALAGGEAFTLRPPLLADGGALARQQQLEQLQATADLLRSLGGAAAAAAPPAPPLRVNRSPSPSPIPGAAPGRSPSRGGCAATAAAAAAAASLPGWDPLWSPTRAPASSAGGCGPPPALARGTDGDAAAQRGPDSPRDLAAKKQQQLFKQQVAAAMGAVAPAGASPSPRAARGSVLDDTHAADESIDGGGLIGTEVVPDRLLPASLLQGSGDSGDLVASVPIGVPSGALARGAPPSGAGRVAALRSQLTGSLEGSFSQWMALAGGGSGARDSSGGGCAAAEDWPLLRATASSGGGAGQGPQLQQHQQMALGMTRHSSICLDACLVRCDPGAAAPTGDPLLTSEQLRMHILNQPGDQRISHAFQMPSFLFASPAGPDGASPPADGQPPARPATAEPAHGRGDHWLP